MLYHLMDVKTPKEACLPRSRNAWRIRYVTNVENRDTLHGIVKCKVKMVVVEGNSATEDLRQGEANERGGAIDEDG